jgi:ferritin-like metal-binding protein YciE
MLAAREKRDAAVADLRKKWQAKLLQLQDQIRRAEEKREREKGQLNQQRMQTAVNIGTSILGALLGRKAISATNIGRVGTAARSASRWGSESADVTRAEESLEVLQQRLGETKTQVEGEVARLESTLDSSNVALRSVEVPARKSDIAVGEVALVWAPWRKGADGFPAPAYD